MKKIAILFTFVFLSANAKAEPDKFVMHCSVMLFLDQLELIDPEIQKTVEKGILEGDARYDGQTGYLCYKISVLSDGQNTNISIILLEKEMEYVRSSFNFRKGKLESALMDVFLDEDKSFTHFYLKGSKKNSYYRTRDGEPQDFSVALFEEHLMKVTPL